jgi:hypothetical protein
MTGCVLKIYLGPILKKLQYEWDCEPVLISKALRYSKETTTGVVKRYCENSSPSPSPSYLREQNS